MTDIRNARGALSGLPTNDPLGALVGRLGLSGHDSECGRLRGARRRRARPAAVLSPGVERGQA